MNCHVSHYISVIRPINQSIMNFKVAYVFKNTARDKMSDQPNVGIWFLEQECLESSESRRQRRCRRNLRWQAVPTWGQQTKMITYGNCQCFLLTATVMLMTDVGCKLKKTSKNCDSLNKIASCVRSIRLVQIHKFKRRRLYATYTNCLIDDVAPHEFQPFTLIHCVKKNWGIACVISKTTQVANLQKLPWRHDYRIGILLEKCQWI